MDRAPLTRTWVAGEVVTASLLNSHLRDDIKVGRGYQRVVRTAGSLTLNNTAWANTSTTLDLTLAATTGDVLESSINALWNNEAVIGYLNAVCVTGGAGFSTKIANTDNGVQSWAGRVSVFLPTGAPAFRTALTGDLAGGNAIIRIRHRTATAANKVLLATTSNQLVHVARNHGPHVAP